MFPEPAGEGAGGRALAGVPNFRDVAHTVAGLKPGCLLRSDLVFEPDEEEARLIAAHGIRLVVDLRGPGERERMPNSWFAARGDDLADVVPNLQYQSVTGEGTPPNITMRGINSIDFRFVNEVPVGTYVDEVFQGNQGAVTGMLFDQERVEVLRGPQGTLFGRNTTAGLIHYISRKPTDELEGYGSFQFGSYDDVIMEGAVGGALTKGIRARVAAKYRHNDGTRRNRNPELVNSRFGKIDTVAARAIVQFDIGASAMLETSMHYANSNSTSTGPGFYGKLDPVTGAVCSPVDVLASLCVNGSGFRDPKTSGGHIYSEHASLPAEYRNYGGYAKLDWDLGFADLVSITAFENTLSETGQDIDGTYLTALNLTSTVDVDFESFSQELRLSGGGGGLRWIGGAFFYKDEKCAHQRLGINGFILPSENRERETRTRSAAVFGQVDYDFTSDFTLSAGLRLTDTKRELTLLQTAAGASLDDIPGGIDDAKETSLTGRARAISWGSRCWPLTIMTRWRPGFIARLMTLR